ncbi:MAG TPA: Gfo/Idh/MocA family oxidoreductase [Gemmatimonadaceae bacterium]|jgi:predicted dehydrogenase|nr:Gfo/Idh/MocA family oxidoreductase [Gemmatimonadaceae bacterium]
MANVRQGDGAPLRVALLGYGLGGAAFHAPFIATTPGLELAVVVTGNPQRQAQAARDHPGARIVGSATEVWEHGAELDVAVISTPNRTHVPLALSAIRAGLHVVVDKPLAPSSAEARVVANTARERGVVLAPFQNRRWDGDFQTVRRLLAEGTLGVPLRFESRFERWRPVPTGSWREGGAPEDAGGLLFDLGSHLIDQALVLFGPVAEVYAELERRREGVAADDDTFVALAHVSGVRSHLWMSAVAAQPGPRFRVSGTRGAYTKWGLDVQEAALRAGEVPGGADWGTEPAEHWGVARVNDAERAIPTGRGDYGGFYRELARSIRSGEPPPVEPNDAISALAVIEAARESSGRGVVVRLQSE